MKTLHVKFVLANLSSELGMTVQNVKISQFVRDVKFYTIMITI